MTMKSEYLEPFIESTEELFSTMLGDKLIRGEAGIALPEERPTEVMGLIGLSGMARGMVALSFPEDTAVKMVNRLLGTDLNSVDDTVSDGIAEMVNIVAGGAKAKLQRGDGPPINLSLPTVVRGSHYNVEYPKDVLWLVAPFSSSLGSFKLRVTMEMAEERPA